MTADLRIDWFLIHNPNKLDNRKVKLCETEMATRPSYRLRLCFANRNQRSVICNGNSYYACAIFLNYYKVILTLKAEARLNII